MNRTVHAVLYTRPNCVQCKKTVKLMRDIGFCYADTYYGDVSKTNSIEENSSNEKKSHGVLIK